MKIDQCDGCSAYDSKWNRCVRHLRNIHDVDYCIAAVGVSTKIKKETGEMFDKKDEPLPEGQRKILVDFLKNLRKSVRYSEKGGDYEIGFYHGWITACNAALATLGIDPLEK